MKICDSCNDIFEKEHMILRNECNHIFHAICLPMNDCPKCHVKITVARYIPSTNILFFTAIIGYNMTLQEASMTCAFLQYSLLHWPEVKNNPLRIMELFQSSNHVCLPFIDITTCKSIKCEYKKWKTIYEELSGQRAYKSMRIQQINQLFVEFLFYN